MRENKGLFFFFFFASKFTDALNLSTHLLGLSSGPGNHVPANRASGRRETGWVKAVRQVRELADHLANTIQRAN